MPVVATITPAVRRALTTPARLRLEPDAPSGTDEALDIAIHRATARLERWCGRVFARERVRERQWAPYASRLLLERSPIVTVHAVSTMGAALVTDSWALEDAAGGVLGLPGTREAMLADLDHDAGWIGDRRGIRGLHYTRPSRAEVAHEVEYTAGYITHGWTGDLEPDVPADLEQACALLAIAALQGSSASTGELVSESHGDSSWTYAQPAATESTSVSLPADVLSIVAPYRRIVF